MRLTCVSCAMKCSCKLFYLNDSYVTFLIYNIFSILSKNTLNHIYIKTVVSLNKILNLLKGIGLYWPLAKS